MTAQEYDTRINVNKQTSHSVKCHPCTQLFEQSFSQAHENTHIHSPHILIQFETLIFVNIHTHSRYTFSHSLTHSSTIQHTHNHSHFPFTHHSHFMLRSHASFIHACALAHTKTSHRACRVNRPAMRSCLAPLQAAAIDFGQTDIVQIRTHTWTQPFMVFYGIVLRCGCTCFPRANYSVQFGVWFLM